MRLSVASVALMVAIVVGACGGADQTPGFGLSGAKSSDDQKRIVYVLRLKHSGAQGAKIATDGNYAGYTCGAAFLGDIDVESFDYEINEQISVTVTLHSGDEACEERPTDVLLRWSSRLVELKYSAETEKGPFVERLVEIYCGVQPDGSGACSNEGLHPVQ